MRVIRLRRCTTRLLCACAVPLLLLAFIPEPQRTPPASPRRHLPLQYWIHREDYPHRYSRSGCISPPGLNEVQQAVPFWQRVTSDAERAVLVFAAYWDDRDDDGPHVRLFVDSEQVPPNLRCLFWYYEVGDPVTTEASIPPQADNSTFYVVSCPLPTPPSTSDAMPAAVSVIPEYFTCGITRNILLIQGAPLTAGVTSPPPPNPRSASQLVGACAVWWRRGDAGARLVEWLELLRVLGVTRVYLYMNHQAHENVMRVVDYFSVLGAHNETLLDVTPYASPPRARARAREARNGSSSSAPNPNDAGADFQEYSNDETDDNMAGERSEESVTEVRRDDLLPYNECVYRARHERLSWLALLDLDEIIVPVRDGKLPALAARESRQSSFLLDEYPDALVLRRYWFPEHLQDLETPPLASPPPQVTLDGRAINMRRSSAAPTLVPPARIFAYERRAPSEHAHEGVSGQLVRVAGAVRVCPRAARCVRACRTRTPDAEHARVHEYVYGCGGRPRGVCRSLRRVAVRDLSLKPWRRAQQETLLTLHRLKLPAHAPSEDDKQ